MSALNQSLMDGPQSLPPDYYPAGECACDSLCQEEDPNGDISCEKGKSTKKRQDHRPEKKKKAPSLPPPEDNYKPPPKKKTTVVKFTEEPEQVPHEIKKPPEEPKKTEEPPPFIKPQENPPPPSVIPTSPPSTDLSWIIDRIGQVFSGAIKLLSHTPIGVRVAPNFNPVVLTDRMQGPGSKYFTWGGGVGVTKIFWLPGALKNIGIYGDVSLHLQNVRSHSFENSMKVTNIDNEFSMTFNLNAGLAVRASIFCGLLATGGGFSLTGPNFGYNNNLFGVGLCSRTNHISFFGIYDQKTPRQDIERAHFVGGLFLFQF